MRQNEKIAASLRRLADRIERSSDALEMKATTSGCEPRYVSVRPVGERGSSMVDGWTPMCHAIFIGDRGFVEGAVHAQKHQGAVYDDDGTEVQPDSRRRHGDAVLVGSDLHIVIDPDSRGATRT